MVLLDEVLPTGVNGVSQKKYRQINASFAQTGGV
jgi:hypothetical protein